MVPSIPHPVPEALGRLERGGPWRWLRRDRQAVRFGGSRDGMDDSTRWRLLVTALTGSRTGYLDRNQTGAPNKKEKKSIAAEEVSARDANTQQGFPSLANPSAPTPPKDHSKQAMNALVRNGSEHKKWSYAAFGKK